MPELRYKIYDLLGDPFPVPKRNFLVGLDETGVGEPYGEMVLTGVRIPAELHEKVKRILGVADTKNKRSFQYWEALYEQIEHLRKFGLIIHSEIVSDSEKRGATHQIMNKIYPKIITRLTHGLEPSTGSITIDDFGIKDELSLLLNHLGAKGFLVRAEYHADDNYIETKLASIISKYERNRGLYEQGRL